MLYSINLISSFLDKSSKNLLIESVLYIYFLFLKDAGFTNISIVPKNYSKEFIRE